MNRTLEILYGTNLKILEHRALFKALEIVLRSKKRPYELPRIYSYPLTYDELRERKDAEQLMKWNIDVPTSVKEYLNANFSNWRNI